MFSEVAEIALVAARLGQFQQLLKTRVILILNFTRPHAITHTNPDFSVKLSDVSEHSEFCYPEKKRGGGVGGKRGGHMIKCSFTELGRAGLENIKPSVMAHGPRCARSVRHDLGPNIFPSGPPTQSIST